MRIVFAARPAFGHIFPLLPLASAAQRRGHEVWVASGTDFLPRLSRYGFRVAKVGESIEWGFARASARYPDLLTQPHDFHFAAAMFGELGKASLSDMRDVLGHAQPDLVVYEATDLGSAVAASSSGVRAVCHSLTVAHAGFAAALRRQADYLWQLHGSRATVDVTAGDARVDIWPRSLQPQDYRHDDPHLLPLRPELWSDPDASAPLWPEQRGPRVFVSLGTMFDGTSLLPKIVAALESGGFDALVVTGAAKGVGGLLSRSKRIRIARFVDQPAALREADAVIHHGGAGTTLGSLRNGLPQLVMPKGADRPFTAAAVTAAGAAMTLPPDDATVRRIATVVSEVVEEPRYRSAAESLSREILAMPSTQEVLKRLEDVA